MNLDQLDDFLIGPARNAWLRIGPYDMYVRKGNHMVEGSVRLCFDLASIQRKEDGKCGRGQFKALLPQLIAKASTFRFEVMFVESLLNPKLETYLKSVGFQEVPGSCPPSVYKRL
jgi:hypothetical protein